MQNEIKSNIILEVRNLTCKFNENHENEIIAINNFSFNFEENKIYFIIGNSGSGKSTLVTHFNGLLKSKNGDIRIDDFWIYGKKKKIKDTKKLRRLISMVFQFPEYQLFKTSIEKDISFGPISLKIPKIKTKEINLKNLKENLLANKISEICSKLEVNFDSKINDFDTFICENNLSFKYKIYSEKDFGKVRIINSANKTIWSDKIFFKTMTNGDYVHEISKKYLNRMGLDDSYLERSPFGLSGGQKRRVAIAGILAIEPKVLIFDEPTAGLDPKGEQEMMEIILDAKKHGQTVIVITHTMDQVLEVADHVVVMDDGKILMHGSPYEIFCNKQLYEKSKMEKPKVIDLIDNLVAKDKKFKILYEKQPKNIDELSDEIKKIVLKNKK